MVQTLFLARSHFPPTYGTFWLETVCQFRDIQSLVVDPCSITDKYTPENVLSEKTNMSSSLIAQILSNFSTIKHLELRALSCRSIQTSQIAKDLERLTKFVSTEPSRISQQILGRAPYLQHLTLLLTFQTFIARSQIYVVLQAFALWRFLFISARLTLRK